MRMKAVKQQEGIFFGPATGFLVGVVRILPSKAPLQQRLLPARSAPPRKREKRGGTAGTRWPAAQHEGSPAGAGGPVLSSPAR
jgi:hypothetical protein